MNEARSQTWRLARANSRSSGEAGLHAPRHWASLSVEEALSQLGTSPGGLEPAQAARRLALYGTNRLPQAAREPWFVDLSRNFFHLFALMLWAAAGLAWSIGTPELSLVIVGVIVVNGVFGYWQEYQASRAVEALQSLLPRQVTVRRAGQIELIAAENLVPGDILVLIEGEAVPADARLVSAELLRVDTSSLTGESRPVSRVAAPVDAASYGDVRIPNLVFAGSTIAGGHGEAVVFATGAATEFGRIAALTRRGKERPSPLQREVIRMTHVIGLLSLIMGTVFFALATGSGRLSQAEGLLYAIGIIVANVPEGLLPTLTLALAMAVRRMAGRKALVKQLPAVETLGATNLILTDKTGTLTENEMVVRELWTLDARYRLTGSGYEPRGAIEPVEPETSGSAAAVELLRVAALCCDARLVVPHGTSRRWTAIGDPTEAAILAAAAKAGLGVEALALAPRINSLPFDSVRKRMTTIQLIDGARLACVKGATIQLLPLCEWVACGGALARLDESAAARILAAHDRMAERGLRVLAVASRNVDSRTAARGWTPEEIERQLTFLGLIAMEDPPREEVPGAIAACRSAGIDVMMVTGDDALTARAIGREIGLYSGAETVLTGAELDRLTDSEAITLMARKNVLFARVSPEHKLRLVRAAQATGAVVAVTGDGVNDAPALRLADIGVAMGETGSDVAREAADMVLADDNFASIVAAVELGRTVYQNVRKFLTYVLTHNVPEAAAFIAFILFSIPLPLSAAQILAIDLGTEVFPALALGVEPPEPDVMRQPPRSRRERLLDSGTAVRIYLWLGLIESGLLLAGYFAAFVTAGWRPGMPLPAAGVIYRRATTMSFAGIVACQIGNAFACRSRNDSLVTQGLLTNRKIFLGIAGALLLLFALVYVRPVAIVFGFEPLRPIQWAVLALFGPLLLGFEEMRKFLRRRWSAQTRFPI